MKKETSANPGDAIEVDGIYSEESMDTPGLVSLGTVNTLLLKFLVVDMDSKKVRFDPLGFANAIAAEVLRPAATSGDAPTELQRLKADEHGEFLSMQAVMKIRNGIKPGDGWGGDEWDYALANAVADRLARIERAAATAIASGDLRAEFERTEPDADLSKAFAFGAEGEYANPALQNRWIGYQRARAAVSAATKPAPIDLSTLPRYDATPGAMIRDESGYWVPFRTVQSLLATKPTADLSASGLLKLWKQAEEAATDTMPALFQFARSLLATKPAAQTVPEGFVLMPKEPTPEMVKAAKDAWWKGCSTHVMKTTDAYRVYFAMLAAAPAATPAAQDQAEFPHDYRKWDLKREDYVMPPFAAPAVQLDAAFAALVPFAELAELFDPENRGSNMPSKDEHTVLQYPRLHKNYELTVGHLRAARTVLASRCRAQGGDTQADSAQAHPAASADAVVEASQWISIEDRLPKDCEMVLVFYHDPHDTEPEIWSAQWLEGSETFESASKGWVHAEEVSHWMPLPAAPASSGVLRTGEGEGNA